MLERRLVLFTRVDLRRRKLRRTNEQKPSRPTKAQGSHAHHRPTGHGVPRLTGQPGKLPDAGQCAHDYGRLEYTAPQVHEQLGAGIGVEASLA
jgi:hypothetical protein